MITRSSVERRQLKSAHWARSEPDGLGDGETRLAIDAFALTSNDVTYAGFGDGMNYWGLFPPGAAATGRIPVWGFANVVASRCADLAAGERFYGYCPIATDVVPRPCASTQLISSTAPNSAAKCTPPTTMTAAAVPIRDTWPHARPNRRCRDLCSPPRS